MPAAGSANPHQRSRRDERQHTGPHPHDEDVRVAGPSPGEAGETGRWAPGGDTLGFATVQAEPQGSDPNDTAWDMPATGLADDTGTGEPPEEPATGPRRRGPARAGTRAGARAGARAGRRGGGRRRADRKAPAARNGLRAAAVAAGAAVAVGGGAVTAFALSGDGETTVGPNRPLADAAAPTPTIDPRVMEKVRHEKALERAAAETGRDGGGKPALQAVGKPLPTKKPEPEKTREAPDDDEGSGGGSGARVADPVPAGEAQQIAKAMLPDFGFGGDGQFGCLVKLWDKESGWNVHADNPSSEAYGIPQANPGSKMSSAGPDWENNARTQIKWGLGYIKDRYDTPCGAWSHSQEAGFY
ncbi:lytic transglycosylase domain-containing protein [Actinomadura sp. WMMB 499]|uniref:aggregation-promoting factor C-terminal-like domain-containing protein n=1 Tax=Actinomadura sp. WMMB 499 TaxID=1219491 RepID=UPI001245C736|nr:lytic transglycosylase domain-containing protein [Actinomadura sp. WMMB 499]QFG24832.1 lytic transglycosylase domain-containing protein [Actinomadura sp. WMMB 499]